MRSSIRNLKKFMPCLSAFHQSNIVTFLPSHTRGIERGVSNTVVNNEVHITVTALQTIPSECFFIIPP